MTREAKFQSGERPLVRALSRWEWEGGSLESDAERHSLPTPEDPAVAGGLRELVTSVPSSPGAGQRRG
jgi:hypothetical protein